MQQLSFKLEVYEGPLDLLLHLISKHKLNIYDIEISILLEQYINYIEEMQAQDLEVASEFLTMAARLVYIKTLSLLPKHDEGEELKKELEGQLLEYQLAKAMAGKLEELNRGGLLFIRELQEIEVDKTYHRKHNKQELLDAYIIAIGKAKRKLPPPKTAFSGIVSRRMVSVESRIVFILKKLYQTGQVSYQEFFYSDDRSELVATFLAMLELIKSKRIQVNEDNTKVTFQKDSKLVLDDTEELSIEEIQ
ncbi:segregation/condensation protein A [Paludicola sp. MB14-C6]|uniref:segregation and condensation protein A n=1 Tax=Paludihabitans sp. MB14-C6 TaxID=3070656 RepID=UPI0027DE62FE|nr:segregation/condensation protein A [Paludicola sp. MB14-C6]WMJ22235.1 segregation/condensation protein A [Paludicola sp. MB14-C6]